MRFKDQDRSGITTVDQLQEALLAAGIEPYNHLLWSHQRSHMPAGGVFVVTPVAQGYRLTNEERSSVVEEGVYTDQASVVREVLRMSDPRTPQTPEEKARSAAAGRKAMVENAAYRARYAAEVRQRLVARRSPEGDRGSAPSDDSSR